MTAVTTFNIISKRLEGRKEAINAILKNCLVGEPFGFYFHNSLECYIFTMYFVDKS